MRKPVLVALIAGIVVLLVAGIVVFQKYRQADSDYRAMRAMEAETRNRYGDAINEIAMIQDSLNAIVLGDSSAQLLPADLQAERRLMETRGDMALARIAVLKAGIERTKRRIQVLDETLQKSGVRIEGLERMVANLRRSVTSKEQEVAALTGERDALQTRVSGLTVEMAQREDSLAAQAEALENRRRELSTVWYAIGT
jgi:chromosome segregation ATPase